MKIGEKGMAAFHGHAFSKYLLSGFIPCGMSKSLKIYHVHPFI